MIAHCSTIVCGIMYTRDSERSYSTTQPLRGQHNNLLLFALRGVAETKTS